MNEVSSILESVEAQYISAQKALDQLIGEKKGVKSLQLGKWCVKIESHVGIYVTSFDVCWHDQKVYVMHPYRVFFFANSIECVHIEIVDLLVGAPQLFQD